MLRIKNKPLVVCFTLAALLIPSTAHAVEKFNVSVSSPAQRSVVGRTFTLTGTYTPGCIAGYSVWDSTGQKSFDFGLGSNGGMTASQQQSGTFTEKIDLTKPLQADEQGGKVTIADGDITINFFAQNCSGGDTLILTLKTDPAATRDDTQAQTKATATPTVTPSATPSSQAGAVTVAAANTSSDTPDWWQLAIAALIGGLIVALGEWSARRYHNRGPATDHPNRRR